MNRKTQKQSPLYTRADIAEQKAATVKRLGKDTDGAYRASRRIDGKV